MKTFIQVTAYGILYAYATLLLMFLDIKSVLITDFNSFRVALLKSYANKCYYVMFQRTDCTLNGGIKAYIRIFHCRYFYLHKHGYHKVQYINFEIIKNYIVRCSHCFETKVSRLIMYQNKCVDIRQRISVISLGVWRRRRFC